MICDGCAYFDTEITDWLITERYYDADELAVLCRYPQTKEGGEDMYPDFLDLDTVNEKESCKHRKEGSG